MIKYLKAISTRSAKGLVASVYSQIQKDFGKVVEPFQLHSPIPQLLAGTWMACRETELVGNVPREIKEAIAATVSSMNNCQYCVDAHTIMLKAIGQNATANAISHGRYNQTSAKIQSIIKWTLTTGSPIAREASPKPFSILEAPEIIGTAVFYHYMNRMVTILLGKTPLPTNNSQLKDPLKRLASMMFAPAVHRPKIAGESLDFLPPTTLPEDFGWAEENPIVAQAFARFAATINSIGEQIITSQIRRKVSTIIDGRDGQTFDSSRVWLENEAKDLDEASKSTAQLVLQAALAPFQVNEKTILEFRQYYPSDDSLLGVLAWGSFSAARKIGAWTQIDIGAM